MAYTLADAGSMRGWRGGNREEASAGGKSKENAL